MKTHSVKVYQIKLSYNAIYYQTLFQSLNDLEGNYLKKYKDFNRRYESLIALMVSKYIAKKEGFKPKTFLHNQQGKPILEGFDGAISVAHIDGYVVVAISNSLHQLGIDIEYYVPSNVDYSVFMTRNEQLLQIEGLTEIEKVTTLWTLKEAYVKYKGTGFLLDPLNLEFMYRDKNWYIQQQQLYAYSFKMQSDRVLSLVADQPISIIWSGIEEQSLLNGTLTHLK